MASKRKKVKSKYTFSSFKRELPLHLMILPALILVMIFSYTPMAGLVIAFQKFIPSKGMFGDQQWVGLGNFKYVFSLPGFNQALKNTVVIAFWKIILGLAVPIVFALLLNEVSRSGFKRTVQTIVYLPYFLSWVVLGGIFLDMLSPSSGIINQIITALGGKSIFFLGDNRYFTPTLIVTDIWKNFGYGAIVYLAAILGIDTDLYEAAQIDGANRWRQTWHITLPGILSTIVLMTVLSMADILNGGFDQIYNLYSPAVYSTGDILDTFVYRLGIERTQFALSTAAGLFKSGVSLVFITASYWMADRFAGYRIF